MQNNSIIYYKINSNDEIVFLSSSWYCFAQENDAPELIAGNVLNQSLWDFITDETTRQLYNDMLKLVRNGESMRFNFNCDSAAEVSLMEMLISPDENGGVQFQTRPLSINERPPQRVLDRNAPRTSNLISICGWCKAIDIGSNNDWKNLEDGISALGLFEQHNLPELSHGMCEACYSVISEKISQRNKDVRP